MACAVSSIVWFAGKFRFRMFSAFLLPFLEYFVEEAAEDEAADNEYKGGI